MIRKIKQLAEGRRKQNRKKRTSYYGRLGADFCSCDSVCFVNSRASLSAPGQSPVLRVWQLSHQCCFYHRPFDSLLRSHLCLLTCHQGSSLYWFLTLHQCIDSTDRGLPQRNVSCLVSNSLV